MTSLTFTGYHTNYLFLEIRGAFLTKSIKSVSNNAPQILGRHNSPRSYSRSYSTQINRKYGGRFRNFKEIFHQNSSSIHSTKCSYSSEVNEADKSNQAEGSVRTANEIILKKQQDVYHILKFLNNPLYDDEFKEIYKNYKIEEKAHYFEDKAYKCFMKLWKNEKFLEKNAIFSIFNELHLKQVKAVYGLLHTVKDYPKFHATAVWLRKVLNESMFAYLYAVSIHHRADTQGLALPPIYELTPQYFFNNDVMEEAYRIKEKHFKGEIEAEDGFYIIRTDPSRFYDKDPEKALCYYMEDVGISAFYHYFNQYFPQWMNAKEYELDEKRGELYYYVHHQLLARYYMERLSYGLGTADYFNWDGHFEVEYSPSMTYPNGTPFPSRPKVTYPKDYFLNYGHRWNYNRLYGFGYTFVDTYEKRVADAIDLGYAYDVRDGAKVDLYARDVTNTIANIIEGNEDSLNKEYFGTCMNFARHLLANTKKAADDYSIVPSALEHFETMCRDPAFYNLCKRVTHLFQKYKANLPPYTAQDLTFPGVRIDNVETGPFVSIYDKFYSDITNGFTLTEEEYNNSSNFRVKVEDYRLHYKTFNSKILIHSDKHIKATLKIFLGPKYDEKGHELSLKENRCNFVEWDQFIIDLEPGINEINKSSRDLIWFGTDRTSYLDVYKHITSNPEEVYKVDDFMNAYPQRFLLPRGTEEGLPFQIFVIVYPYETFQSETTFNYYQTKYNQDSVFTGPTENEDDYDRLDQYKMIRIDSYPMGYPFDRPAEFDQVYRVPNAHLMDIKIYHEKLKI